MSYTVQQKADEFWMLTKGILQDSTVDTEEASVIRHWLQEHCEGPEFDAIRSRLDKFLSDGYIDRFESKALIDTIGSVLRVLRSMK